MAELDLQIFLDACFEYEIQPIVRVATRFDPRSSSYGVEAVKGSWVRPDWDEPKRWREYFEKARWPTERVWIIAGNEPNLGREWGGAVDAAGLRPVSRPLHRRLRRLASLQGRQRAARHLERHRPAEHAGRDGVPRRDGRQPCPGISSGCPPGPRTLTACRPPGRGPGTPTSGTRPNWTGSAARCRSSITEAGHLETGDEQEIANFYADAYRDWLVDPESHRRHAVVLAPGPQRLLDVRAGSERRVRPPQPDLRLAAEDPEGGRHAALPAAAGERRPDRHLRDRRPGRRAPAVDRRDVPVADPRAARRRRAGRPPRRR